MSQYSSFRTLSCTQHSGWSLEMNWSDEGLEGGTDHQQQGCRKEVRNQHMHQSCLLLQVYYHAPILPRFWADRCILNLSLMCVSSAMIISSLWQVSNSKVCMTPATRVLKKTAMLLQPNCLMSRSSAEFRYSLGRGLWRQG